MEYAGIQITKLMRWQPEFPATHMEGFLHVKGREMKIWGVLPLPSCGSRTTRKETLSKTGRCYGRGKLIKLTPSLCIHVWKYLRTKQEFGLPPNFSSRFRKTFHAHKEQFHITSYNACFHINGKGSKL